MTPDIIAAKERAEKFIKRNKVKASNKKVVCGDGRFTPEQSQDEQHKGYIRMFGGEEGVAMIVKGALNKKGIDISNDNLVPKIASAVINSRESDSPFGVHDDNHQKHEGDISGCGYVNNAYKISNLHKNLSAQDVKAIHEVVMTNPHEEVVLQGSHKEDAVLIIRGQMWSVNSFDPETGEMNFVVDDDRNVAFLGRVHEHLGIEGLELSDLVEQYRSQMERISSVLAAGKPIFAVQFDDAEGSFILNYQGKVPPLQ